MTQSDDLTRIPHEIDDLVEDPNNNNGDPETPESTDDEQTEVGTNQVDDSYNEVFGNDPEGKTIKQEINKDEIDVVKD